MGKGDNRRPENVAAFKAGFERTFGSKPSEQEMSDFDKRKADIQARDEARRKADIEDMKAELAAAMARSAIPHNSKETDDEGIGSEADDTYNGGSYHIASGGTEDFDADD
jgi:hypothetical protein